MEWVGLEGSLKITEPWNELGWKGPSRLQSHGMGGLEGSLKTVVPWDKLEGLLQITDPWYDCVGRVLKNHRDKV